MSTWEEIFKKDGKVFTNTQEDIPNVAKLFKKMKIKRILDLGCGTGRHVIYLSKKGFDVYGFDVSRTGVIYTKKWLKKEKLNAKVIVHEMTKKFPYPDNFFDAVISIQVIHHNKLNKVRKTIREVKRVLRTNGMIFISVPTSKKLLNKKYKKIAPGTYIHLDGKEKGLVHYYFNKKKIYEEFRGFKIRNIHIDSNDIFCILGEKK
jgi:cyclopropane fatty-acyl-phospholipid synthase-like methyltransferase